MNKEVIIIKEIRVLIDYLKLIYFLNCAIG